MSGNLKRKDFSDLPETAGLFCLFNKENKALFAGAAENLKNEISRILESENHFSGEISAIEIRETNENLPREFARLIRRKKPRFNFFINDQALYPHLKITGEKFPRMLVTRRILSEADEYFGAFLPATGVRIWLYVLNKIFRLRSCELEICGDDLPAPCAMFREKRCQAPCRTELCDEERYAQSVDLLRLFLRRDEKELESRLKMKIESLAENLEFEAAGFWRDTLHSIENIFANKRMNLWLDDAVDTFYLEKKESEKLVHVVTTRARRTLGFHTFVFPLDERHSDSFVLSQILWQFYQFHAPRAIRVTRDFEGRRFFAQCLSRQAGRDVKVSAISEKEYKTAFLALKRSKLDLEMKRLSGLKTTEEIQSELREIFSLSKAPHRIEAFDVAHIANENFVAACAVWENGKIEAKYSRFWLLDSANEPQAMAEAVKSRLHENALMPDLIVIDGGKGQLKAVLPVLSNAGKPKIIGAVKPSGRHGEISHFLTGDGERINFAPKPAFEILRALRDEAHALANEIHRQRRENRVLFEGEPEKNVLVPIRFDEPGGAAENLRLISKIKF